mmetsp:Transcript_576/g.616  ORF Transcript_576/g.616 Transcript_576/m.616 type:complete len:81 (-) Transcript_576:346-588(-)
MVIYHHLWPTLFFSCYPVARSKSIHLSRPIPVNESLEKRWGVVVGYGPGNVRAGYTVSRKSSDSELNTPKAFLDEGFGGK